MNTAPRRSVLSHLHFGVEPPDEALGGLCTLGDLRIEGPRGLCGDDLLERFALRYQHRHSVAHCKHHVALRYQGRPVGGRTVPWNDLGRRARAPNGVAEPGEQSCERAAVGQLDKGIARARLQSSVRFCENWRLLAAPVGYRPEAAGPVNRWTQ